MGDNLPQAVTTCFPQAGGTQRTEEIKVVFDLITGADGIETPLPKDHLASISPPTGVHLHSYRRDWLKEKCSNNMFNIITYGYALPFISKPKLARLSLILSGYKTHQRDLALDYCIQSFLSKNVIEWLENTKSLGSQLPVSRAQVPSKMEASASSISPSGSLRVPGDWLVQPQVSNLSVHFSSFRPSHGPANLYSVSKGREAHGPFLDDWLIRARYQEEAQLNTQIVVNLTQSLGLIINQKSELKPTLAFSFVGYEYHIDLVLVKPIPDRWLKLQNLIHKIKSKPALTARCLMLVIGLLTSTEKMVPEGHLHKSPFQWHLKEHRRFSQSVDTLRDQRPFQLT